jgi:hypothetical protein
MTFDLPPSARPELRLQTSVPEFNNSAGRLLALLRDFAPGQNYFENISRMHGGGEGLTKAEKARLYVKFMAMLGDAYEECLSAIRSSPKMNDPTRDLYIVGLNSLGARIFTDAPGSNWIGISESEFTNLRLASATLDQELSLGEDDLDSIADSLESLLKQLRDSSIGDEARKSLMDLIRHASFAVDYYRIFGVEGFGSAFKKMIGDYVYALQRKDGAPGDEGLWNGFKNLLSRFDSIYAKALKYRPLFEAGMKFLPPG